MIFPSPLKYKTIYAYSGKGIISGTLKVNNVATHRKIFLFESKTQNLLDWTSSDEDGNYSFVDLNENIEYDLRAKDFNRNYLDNILTAVKPKLP